MAFLEVFLAAEVGRDIFLPAFMFLMMRRDPHTSSLPFLVQWYLVPYHRLSLLHNIIIYLHIAYYCCFGGRAENK